LHPRCHPALPASGPGHRQPGLYQTGQLHGASQAIERADKALYYSKSHGRNQVNQFEALQQLGMVSEAEASGDIDLF
jgi:hypothetical protein